MPTISVRMYWEGNDIKRWERLESKDKLGPLQKEHLDAWRTLKKIYPAMIAMAYSGNHQYCVWKES